MLTKEQRRKAAGLLALAEAEMLERYGRLIYCCPADELQRIEAEWTEHKRQKVSATAPAQREPNRETMRKSTEQDR